MAAGISLFQLAIIFCCWNKARFGNQSLQFNLLTLLFSIKTDRLNSCWYALKIVYCHRQISSGTAPGIHCLMRRNTMYLNSGRMCMNKRSMVRLFSSHLVVLVLLSGCMNMRVVAKHDSSNPVPESVTRWTWFWGLQQPNDVVTDPSCASICMLTAKTNFGYLLISTLSLGIAVPMRVEYSCCPYEPPAGDL